MKGTCIYKGHAPQPPRPPHIRKVPGSIPPRSPLALLSLLLLLLLLLLLFLSSVEPFLVGSHLEDNILLERGWEGRRSKAGGAAPSPPNAGVLAAAQPFF